MKRGTLVYKSACKANRKKVSYKTNMANKIGVKPIKYRFFLPGEDDLRVETLGYSYGLDAMPLVLAARLPQDAPPPDAVYTNMPIDSTSEEVRKMAHGTCDVFLQAPDEMRTTNNPDLFHEHYAKGFLNGYQFGVYAMAHGLMQILHSYPGKRYYLLYRFAWELIMQEPAPDEDVAMNAALEELNVLYRQYKSLN